MRWFQPLWNHSLCFHNGRIEFERQDGTQDHFGFGTIFVYLGPHKQRFEEIFPQFGRIVKATDTPPSQPQQPTLWDMEGEAV